MAKYKNREVNVLEELPGEQTRIEHTEPGVMGTEIVPKSHVYLSKDERKVVEDKRKAAVATNDFRNIGDKDPIIAPSTEEVRIQQLAERHLKKEAEEKKIAEDQKSSIVDKKVK